jgi:hypothetical protein
MALPNFLAFHGSGADRYHVIGETLANQHEAGMAACRIRSRYFRNLSST